MAMQPAAKAMALAIAAPITPQPAPGMVKERENILMLRVGYMSRKFRTMFIRFTHIPTRMGVLVSPTARSMVPKIIVAARASMGV